MSNAKQELLEFCKENKVNLKCALVEEVYYGLDKDKRRKFLLPVDYTSKQLNDFLTELDFEYDDGFGSEYLGGTLWFIEGTWAERGEYDGSEWWEYHELPPIPEELTTHSKQSTSGGMGK